MITLIEIDTKLKDADIHNTKLTERKNVYAEKLMKEFGVTDVDGLKVMLETTEASLAEKNTEYEEALAEAEALLVKAGISC